MRLGALALGLCLLLGALPGAGAQGALVYTEGFAPVEENGLWGFAGPGGEIAIQPRYDSVSPFSLGMAQVELHGKAGVIRSDGKYLLPPEYDSLQSLGCGLYIAQKGENWGVVSVVPYTDKEGEPTRQVYPLEYLGAELGKSGGLDALILTARGGGRTVVPLFRLPETLTSLGVAGDRFPLTGGAPPVFSDVEGREWFSLWADVACNTGIMSGTGGGAFEPGRIMTVAEALQMAANMDSRYRGDDFHTTVHISSPWYNAAVNYCQASGITALGQFDDYERRITRRELAQVFGATSLARSLPQRASLSQVAARVGDVSDQDPDAAAIFGLYAKGILTGVDGTLSFRPDAAVTRAEAAALAARLVRPEQRVDLF